MSTAAGRRLLVNAFVMATPTHNNPTQWRRPDAGQIDYHRLSLWTDLARELEAAAFDGIFFADILGLQGAFRGNWDEHIEKALDYPTNDPLVLAAALAGTTENIGIAFTNSIIQNHPATFARQVATLDHLSGGRIAWNIVTSSLENSHRNVSVPDLVPHDERYRNAAHYLDAVFAVLEGRATGVDGRPFAPESPQRTPFLFLAGASPQGQAFAAANAEAQFISSRSPQQAAEVVRRIRAAAQSHGRLGTDVKLFQTFDFVVGSTQEEAERKYRETDRYTDAVAKLVQLGGTIGVDFGRFELDEPIDHRNAQGGLGPFQALLAASPNGQITIRQLLERRSKGVVGTPETIADAVQAWFEAGVDGINVGNYTIPGTYTEFIAHVLPELRARGLTQRDYQPGTLRQKLTGSSSPYLDDRHPAARFRVTADATADSSSTLEREAIR